MDNVHDCLLSGLLETEKVGSHLERLCLLFSPHLARPAGGVEERASCAGCALFVV